MAQVLNTILMLTNLQGNPGGNVTDIAAKTFANNDKKIVLYVPSNQLYAFNSAFSRQNGLYVPISPMDSIDVKLRLRAGCAKGTSSCVTQEGLYMVISPNILKEKLHLEKGLYTGDWRSLEATRKNNGFFPDSLGDTYKEIWGYGKNGSVRYLIPTTDIKSKNWGASTYDKEVYGFILLRGKEDTWYALENESKGKNPNWNPFNTAINDKATGSLMVIGDYDAYRFMITPYNRTTPIIMDILNGKPGDETNVKPNTAGYFKVYEKGDTYMEVWMKELPGDTLTSGATITQTGMTSYADYLGLLAGSTYLVLQKGDEAPQVDNGTNGLLKLYNNNQGVYGGWEEIISEMGVDNYPILSDKKSEQKGKGWFIITQKAVTLNIQRGSDYSLYQRKISEGELALKDEKADINKLMQVSKVGERAAAWLEKNNIFHVYFPFTNYDVKVKVDKDLNSENCYIDIDRVMLQDVNGVYRDRYLKPIKDKYGVPISGDFKDLSYANKKLVQDNVLMIGRVRLFKGGYDGTLMVQMFEGPDPGFDYAFKLKPSGNGQGQGQGSNGPSMKEMKETLKGIDDLMQNNPYGDDFAKQLSMAKTRLGTDYAKQKLDSLEGKETKTQQYWKHNFKHPY